MVEEKKELDVSVDELNPKETTERQDDKLQGQPHNENSSETHNEGHENPNQLMLQQLMLTV